MTAPTREPCPVCGRPIPKDLAELCWECWDSFDKYCDRRSKDGKLAGSGYINGIRWAVQRSKRWAKRRGES